MESPFRNSARHRTGLLALSLIGSMAILGILSVAQGNSPPRPSHNVPSGKFFKNIKVFKKLPSDQLVPMMHNWNTSLGVECSFCHVVGKGHEGFALDDKPTKNTARQMVLLVQHLNANEKSIDHKATCFMCHHGRPEPELTAPQKSE